MVIVVHGPWSIVYGLEKKMKDKLLREIKYDANGLVPAIVQDVVTKDVLMMAWMNAESLRLTFETGETIFWSRSRQEIWHKGATSGNVQKVVEIRVDCDTDTLLVLVEPAGPACHTGKRTCFYRSI
jgi:phosphoribosyl-AMP cyclohydrolase